MKIRIRFSKTGNIRYIGHLDMMRFFQKAVKRAGIDIAYSKGFSPHQIMSFAYPLGVGMTTLSDYFDIEVNSAASSEEIVKSLNSVMVSGVSVLGAFLLPDNAENAMASVKASGYIVTPKDGVVIPFDIKEAVERLNLLKNIPYLKKTEKTKKEIDLKEGIYEIKHCDNGIYMLINSSSAGNIKPLMVMESIYREMLSGEIPDISNHFDIRRTETYLCDENGKLKPLSYAGKEF